MYTCMSAENSFFLALKPSSTPTIIQTILMPQQWQIIAPARQETTGTVGELMDALVSSSAAGLVALLAIPLSTYRLVRHERLRD